MAANEQPVRRLIAQEAADWFVANRGGLTARERSDFAAWLRSSPVHVQEYLSLSVIARDLRAACRDSEESLEALVARARNEEVATVRPLWPRALAGLAELARPRWQTALGAMAALALTSVALLALWKAGTVAPGMVRDEVVAVHYQTRHGEQQNVRLADDSVLHLNTDSAVSIRYAKDERRVTLEAGEAFFDVVHAPGRPFRVFAGTAQVVDVGTRFDVRLEARATAVTVLEGRVAVGPLQPPPASPGHNSPPAFVQLGADQQISVGDGQWPATPTSVNAARSTAWLHRQIMFEQEPLERVASEFNRYATKPIEITTPALRSLQISGVFATDDTQAFIAFLRSLDGVRVEVTDKQIRVSQN